jgi:hypothetical protein
MNRNELIEAFVLANEFKEGDLLVGGTQDEDVRREARAALASIRLGEISRVAFVEDRITEALARSLDRQIAVDLSVLTLDGRNGSSYLPTRRRGRQSIATDSRVKPSLPSSS